MSRKKAIWELPVAPSQRAGVRLAIRWHRLIASNYRESIEHRKEHGIYTYGELKWLEETHDGNARSLEEMLAKKRRRK